MTNVDCYRKIFGQESPDYDSSTARSKKQGTGSTFDKIRKAHAEKQQRHMDAAQAERSALPAPSTFQPAFPSPATLTSHPHHPSSSSSSNHHRESLSPEQSFTRQPLGPSSVANSSHHTINPLPTPAPTQPRLPCCARQVSEFDECPLVAGSNNLSHHLYDLGSPTIPSNSQITRPDARLPTGINQMQHYPYPPLPQLHTQQHGHYQAQQHHLCRPTTPYMHQYDGSVGTGGHYPPQNYQ